MRKYTAKTISEDTIEKVFCNCCGKEIPKDKLGYFADYLHIEKQWNYFSKKDGQRDCFDLCEDCYDTFVKTFAISVEQNQ